MSSCLLVVVLESWPVLDCGSQGSNGKVTRVPWNWGFRVTGISAHPHRDPESGHLWNPVKYQSSFLSDHLASKNRRNEFVDGAKLGGVL